MSVETIVKILRKPAGDDPRFADFDCINANLPEFIAACHLGFMKLHVDSIQTILSRELDLSSDYKVVNSDAAVLQARRAKDALVWTGFRHMRHQVKAVCEWDKDRPLLGSANVESVFAFMASNVPIANHFAIWSDATSFAGPGDILVFGKATDLVELKQIGDDIYPFTPRTTKEELKAVRKIAHGIRGQSMGDKLVDRLQRQVGRLADADRLIREEWGVHPYTRAPVFKRDISTPSTDYCDEVDRIVASASAGKAAVTLVDECLWVGA